MLAQKQLQSMTKFYNLLSEIADDFDGFIIDLWGVLHDGQAAYPNAKDTLRKLHESGKKIILLSNAPRRAAKAKETLDRLGFDQDLYDHILTSGEVTYDFLKNSTKYGQKYYYIGPPKDEDLASGLDYIRVNCPSEADFALVTGFDNFGDQMETKLPEIIACLKADLPLLCANPDRIVVRQTGEIMLCSGLLAEYYSENGGDVMQIGKPYEKVYLRAMELLGIKDVSKICAIGDSLHTDIDGANNMKITSILIAGGILKTRLGNEFGELPTRENFDKICKEESSIPAILLPEFAW